MKTLLEYAALLEKGEITSLELCKECLETVKRLNPGINAFIAWDESSVLQAAAASDARRASGKALSPLDGIPVGIKDNISVAGERCSCASRFLEDFKAVYDAGAVQRLKASGMIPFGRLNMDEFAMGGTSQNSAFGGVRNPVDVSRIPGGSSGGAAAAVAAGMIPCALGSDTGGSIRQPAAYCGIVGFKPAYGAVSRSGLVAFASSLDQIGPMTQTVRDAAALYAVIAGHDPKDATSVQLPLFEPELPVHRNLEGLTIGLPRTFIESEGVDARIRENVLAAAEKFRSLGAQIVDVELPHARYAVSVYYILATAEASANLARFDGIRYGKRAPSADLLSLYSESREEGFGTEVKRRIILGTYVLSSGYYDAYYLRAQKVRTLIKKDYLSALERCDAILTPVSPVLPPKIGDKSTLDPLQLFLADVFTTPLNLTGGCGISIPSGRTPENLPLAVQLTAATDPAPLFRIASAFEENR